MNKAQTQVCHKVSFDLSLSGSRRLATLPGKLSLRGLRNWGTHPTHSDSAMSQSILQNYKFVTFAAFTPLQLTVTRFSRNVAVCRPICHAPSRWPYGQLKTPLTFAYLLDGLSAMSQALQLMAIVFFSFPNVCTWNRPEPSSKLLHVLVMYLCTGVFSFSKIIQRGKFVRIFI